MPGLCGVDTRTLGFLAHAGTLPAELYIPSQLECFGVGMCVCVEGENLVAGLILHMTSNTLQTAFRLQAVVLRQVSSSKHV